MSKITSYTKTYIDALERRVIVGGQVSSNGNLKLINGLGEEIDAGNVQGDIPDRLQDIDDYLNSEEHKKTQVPKSPTTLTELQNEGFYSSSGPMTKVTIGWLAPTQDIFDQPVTVTEYQVYINNAPAYRVNEPKVSFELRSGEDVDMYVIGATSYGVWSDPSDTVNITAEKALYEAATPTAPILSSSLGVLAVRWNGLYIEGPGPAQSYVVVHARINSGPDTIIGSMLSSQPMIIPNTSSGDEAEVWFVGFDKLDRETGTSTHEFFDVTGIDLPDLDQAVTDFMNAIDTKANNAQTAANNAQTAANNAQTAAEDANDAALEAVGLVGSKGEVIFSNTTPPAAKQLAQNLWIDTTSGSNTPKRWNGTSWVVVTDKAATDAAAAAVTAKDRADAAFTAATNAATAAGNAQTSADGKNRVWYLGSEPAGTGHKVDDVWFNTSQGNRMARWSGSAWVVVEFGGAALANSAVTAVKLADEAVTAAKIAADAITDAKLAPAVRTSITTAQSTATNAQNIANAAQTKANTASDEAQAAQDAADLLRSRGNDLITNGNGILGSANFSNFVREVGDQPVGAHAAYRSSTGGQQVLLLDEFIQIDPSKKYSASMAVKQASSGVSARFYFGLAPFDAYGLVISPYNFMEQSGSRTTLAADLKPGDTVVQLTSSAGWYNSTEPFYRQIIFWDYVDPSGKTWAPGTYSRNLTASDSWAQGGISGNTITLKAPYSGDLKPAGTSLSCVSSGGSFLYAPGMANKLDSSDWITYTQSDSFTGVKTPGSIYPTTAFPAATASVKVVLLTNYSVSGGTSKQLFANVSLSDVAAASADAALAQNAADAAQSTANSAQTIANAAQTAAGAAQTAANNAQSAANAAQTTANGKNKIVRSTADASAPENYVAGDQWWKYSGTQITAMWLHTGSAWTAQTLTDSVITNLNAGTITAGTIAAARIAANTITGTHISGATITASNMVTGTITAASGIIADAAIGSAKIIDGAITTAKIGDAQITNAKIANLDAGKITTGLLNANRIAAGTITGTHIAGSTIGAEKLMVADLSNMATVSEDLANTSAYDNWTSTVVDGWAARSAITDTYFMFRRNSGPIPFKTGDRIRITFDAYADAAGNASLSLWTYPSGTGSSQSLGTVALTTTPASFALEANVTVDPTNRTTYLVGLANVENRNVYLRKVRVYRMNAGELIVDGAITGSKITVDSAFATKVTADTVLAGKIKTSYIVDDGSGIKFHSSNGDIVFTADSYTTTQNSISSVTDSVNTIVSTVDGVQSNLNAQNELLNNPDNGLVTQVRDVTSNVTGLDDQINNSSNGIVTVVGDSNSGLIKKTNEMDRQLQDQRITFVVTPTALEIRPIDGQNYIQITSEGIYIRQGSSTPSSWVANVFRVNGDLQAKTLVLEEHTIKRYAAGRTVFTENG